jgi:hypothetical protein
MLFDRRKPRPKTFVAPANQSTEYKIFYKFFGILRIHGSRVCQKQTFYTEPLSSSGELS